VLRVSIEHLQPGLVVAQNIYNANSNLLLGHGTVLNEYIIGKLKKINIDAVYVKNPYFDFAYEPRELIREKTRIQTIKIAHNTFKSFSKSKKINVADLQQAVKIIIDDVARNKNSLIYLTDIRTHDDYTFGHSINTCLISVVIGLKMQLLRQEIQELALGVILHDIGKMLIPVGLLNKKETLTAEEWRTLQEHADLGFQISKETVPLLSANVACQHHENYDGSGYPRGISEKDIHLYAKIAAVADLYDAITSDRPYRPAVLPHEAYEVILGSRGTKLDPKIADIFLENVALYPMGTMVLLDTDEIGVVTKIYPKLQARPVIKIILDNKGQDVCEKYIDLTQELTRFIVKVLKPQEIIKIRRPGLS